MGRRQRNPAPFCCCKLRQHQLDQARKVMPTTETALPRQTKICKQCGTLNESGDALPGSGWIEVILWLCYLVPGLIYSIWRRTKRNAACAACSSRELVQVGTPVGSRLLQQYHPDLTVSSTGQLQPPAKKSPPPSGSRIAKAIGLVILFVFVLAFVGGVISRLG